MGIYIDNAGNVEERSWRLDDGGNGNDKFVVASTNRQQNGSINFATLTTDLIDANGNIISEIFELYDGSSNVTVTLSGS